MPSGAPAYPRRVRLSLVLMVISRGRVDIVNFHNLNYDNVTTVGLLGLVLGKALGDYFYIKNWCVLRWCSFERSSGVFTYPNMCAGSN